MPLSLNFVQCTCATYEQCRTLSKHMGISEVQHDAGVRWRGCRAELDAGLGLK